MKKVLMIVFSALLAFSLCACGHATPKALPSAGASGAAASAQASTAPTPTAAPTPTPEIKDRAPLSAWPTDLPPEVPAFTYGTLDPAGSERMTVNGMPTNVLRFTGVRQQDVDGYGATIAGNGFQCAVTNPGGAYTVTGFRTVKDGSLATVSASLDPSGACTVIITVQQQ